MSKRRTPKELRFPICPHGKVQFNTEKAAQIALDECLHRKSGEIRHYRCNECGQYHLTSKSRYTVPHDEIGPRIVHS